jgi:ribosomal-protein-alanine N-acetyltransferase
MTKQLSLTTERLILRPFSLDDAERVRQLAGAREIAENTATMPHPYEEGMAEEWIGTHEELYAKGENIHFAVCLKSTHELLGAIGLVINKDHDRGELGYWMGIPYWNLGYCTEAARAVIKYGFEVLQLNRIGAIHYTRNPASGRVLENIGMRFEGVRRQEMKRWDEYVDVASFGILREEYSLLHEKD